MAKRVGRKQGLRFILINIFKPKLGKSMLDPNAKRIFWYLFAGSRGGNNRIRIIELLKEHPHNINQLAETLNLDYKAIQHHISVLKKNNMVSKVGEKYGVSYFISDYLESNIAAFDQIASQIKKSTK
jgi:DNA-binding transcriptional ArsR family regulator